MHNGEEITKKNLRFKAALSLLTQMDVQNTIIKEFCMEKIPIKDFPFVATPVVLVATEESGKINVAPHGQYGTVIAKPPTLFIRAEGY
jgi:hypothetical protein